MVYESIFLLTKVANVFYILALKICYTDITKLNR